MAQDKLSFAPGYLEEAIGASSVSFDPIKSAADTHEFWDWGDIGMGLVGAPVELASDIYGLADAVTFDALPDWEAGDVVGERTSTAGNLVQSMLPWLFAHAKVAKFLSKGARIGKTKYARGLSSASERALTLSGNIKGAAATRAAREMAASAITTTSLFEEQDGTLSDLLNTVPYLQDVVPDFLESDPEDSEWEARLKAGIEDAGLGAIAGTLSVVLKGRRWVNHLKKTSQGMTPQEIDELADQAIKQQDLAAAMEADGLIGPRLPEAPERSGIDPSDFEPGAADDATMRTRTEADDFSDVARRAEETGVPIEDAIPGTPKPDVDDYIPEEYEKLVEMAEARRQEDFKEILNPRERDANGNFKYSTAELFDALTVRSGMNVKNTLLSSTNPEDMINLIRAIDLRNLERVRGRVTTTEEHLRKAIQRMSDFYEVDEAGLIRVLNPDLLSQRAAGLSDADFMKQLGESAMAHEMTMTPLFDQFTRLMKKFDGPAAQGGGNMDDYIEAMRSMEAFTNAANYANDVYSEAARTLRMRRTPLGGMQPSEIKKILKSQGLDEKAIRKQIERVSAVLKANKHLSPQEQAAAAAKMLRGSKWRFGDVITEYWVNSILSGPSTHVANILGNSLTLALRPLELAGASAITLNSRGMRAAFEQVKSIMSDGMDAMLLGLSAEKNEFMRPIGSTKWQGVGKNRSIGRHTLDQDFVKENPGIAGMVEGVGKLINLPGTALETMDNVFKQLNLRSRLKMRLFDKAFNELGMDSGAASRYVIDEMDRIMENGQLVASETFFKKGLEQGMKKFKGDRSQALVHAKKYAREQFSSNREFVEEAISFAEEGTFTRAHSKERGTLSGIARAAQDVTADYWPMRFYIPFVGTPMNLLIFAWERMSPMEMARLAASPWTLKKGTPQLNAVKSRLKRELMSGDPIIQREAIGRVALGNTMLLTAWHWAQSGKITGKGPADPQQRKMLEQSGQFQPYSFKIGNEFYSYARLDPFATILGTVADLTSGFNQEIPDDTGKFELVAHGVWAALQHNFTQKSFMVGFKSLTEMMQTDDLDKAVKAMRPIAGGFVPSLLKSTVGNPEFPVTGDPIMREVRNLADVALARIPYFSKNLPPQRNVLGDVVQKRGTISKRPGLSIVESAFLPIQYTEVKDGTIMSEFASLTNTAFYPPSKTLSGTGLKLTEFKNEQGQDAYDRYLELHGIVKVDGLTLKQALKALFKTDKYQAAARETLPGVPSPRGKMIKQYISIFKSAARARLFREYPELMEAKAQLQIRSKKQAVAEIFNPTN